MKLSSQEEYGLRCLLQIASAPHQFMTIAEVARREALSTAYVAKLVRLLRRAGFLRSVRGQNGGFELVSPSRDINVGDVLAALGGRFFSEAFCAAHSGELQVCARSIDCSLRPLWTALDEAVHEVLHRTQLSHLMSIHCQAGSQRVSIPASGLQSESHAQAESPLQVRLASDNPVALTKRSQGPL